VVRRNCGSPMGWRNEKIFEHRRKVGAALAVVIHQQNFTTSTPPNSIPEQLILISTDSEPPMLTTENSSNMDLTSGSQAADTMPPSYGSQEYWNNRFAAETEPFEWLEAPESLDPFFRDALSSSKEANPEVLHVGCGTSLLSHHLRTMVPNPAQIHNLDYSAMAIQLGREREQNLRNDGRASGKSMRWDAVDLLGHTSLLSACKPGAYSVIIDKSTSDCIACADDVYIPLPYPVGLHGDLTLNLDLRQSPDPIHPLHIMAVHLALVTKPGARWITLSYSNDRFPFVDGLYSSRPHLPGFPDTSTLWKILDKRQVENEKEESSDSSSNSELVTHRPNVFNWVYVLERTDALLSVRGGHI
jgi:hypothetical protein